MSKKSIILLTSLFLIVSGQNSASQAGFMAGDTDEDTKMEMGQSMRDMQALTSDENIPLLREQENQEKPDMQSRRLSVAFSGLGSTVLEEMIQNTVLQPVLQSDTVLLLRNALVDEVTISLMSKAIGFSPESKTLGEKVERALENFALTLGKFAPYETLD